MRADAAARSAGATRALPQTLGAPAKPLSVLQWLTKPGGRTLADLRGGAIELSHQALDTLARGKSTEDLRAALVHAGALENRDELLATLQNWTDARLDAIAPGVDHAKLRAFATWKINRELAARRARHTGPDVLAATMPKRWIAAAISLIAWLHEDTLTLADLDQALLDQWLTGDRPGRRAIRPFITWLQRTAIPSASLRAPATPPAHSDPRPRRPRAPRRAAHPARQRHDRPATQNRRLPGRALRPARRTDRPPHRHRPQVTDERAQIRSARTRSRCPPRCDRPPRPSSTTR